MIDSIADILPKIDSGFPPPIAMASSPKAPKPHRKFQSIYHPTRPLSLWQDNQHDQGEVRIEIIPLIDVVFCILTFFILGAVGLSRQQAISLDLPRASTGAPQMREMFMVSLDDLGQLYVEKQPVSQEQMVSALQNYHQYNPTGLIVLHASRNASYNDVVQLLDILRTVGGDRVALATLPGDAQTPPGMTPNGFNDPNLGLPGMTPGTTFPNSPNPGMPNFNPNPNNVNPGQSGTPNFSNTPLPGMPSTNGNMAPNSGDNPGFPSGSNFAPAPNSQSPNLPGMDSTGSNMPQQ
ncbi:Biopolymer transport protein ExbD/TolR [Synechocystis sp. PCC 6714]|nr:Biopolymer transport protein ExbD/TolR [Synechocystis sp. PCC 6714]